VGWASYSQVGPLVARVDDRRVLLSDFVGIYPVQSFTQVPGNFLELKPGPEFSWTALIAR
jgi:hypothetical protein